MSDDNKFSIGDILWEYADYTPPKTKAKRPAAAPLAPKGATGQPGMTSPQPVTPPANAQPSQPPAQPKPPNPTQQQPASGPTKPPQPKGSSVGAAAPSGPQPPPPEPSQNQPTPNKEPLPANQAPAEQKEAGADPQKQPTTPPAEPSAPNTPPATEQPAAPEQPPQTKTDGQPAQAPQQPGPQQPQAEGESVGAAAPSGPQPADQQPPQAQSQSAQSPPEQGQPAQEQQAQPAQGQQPQGQQPPAQPITPQDNGPDLIGFTPDPNAKKPGAAQATGQTARQPLKGFGPKAGTAGQTTKVFEGFHPFRDRKARAQAAPPPDAAPAQLSLEYGVGLKALKHKTLGTLALTIVLVLLAFMDTGILPFLTDLIPENILRYASLGGFVVCCALAWDVLQDGLVQLTNFTPGSSTLALFASVFTLADGVTMVLTPLRESAVSFFAPCALVLLFQLIGRYCERSSKFQSCRMAASVAQPYVVTQDANVLAGKPGFRKWVGAPKGFGSQIRTTSRADAKFQKLTPVLMTACVCLSLLTTVAHHQPKLVLWSLSALFTASATLGAPLALNLPLQLFSGKLTEQGVALAGQPGLDATKGARAAVLLDGDLYPPGTVSLLKSEPLSELPMDRALGYTAALIRASGSGLSSLFGWALRTAGGKYVTVEKLVLQDGGLIGQAQGQQVLVGNSDFMSKQGIALPTGIKYTNRVFCALDRELIGMFELKYALHATIVPSLKSLLAHHIAPLLATRDFNINPNRMRLSDRLPKEQLTYPDVQRRVELSSPNQPHGQTIVALLCREGMAPFSLALIASKRIRRAAGFSSFFVRLSACVGVILTATLSSAGALGAMSAWHMTLFLLLWFVPVLFLSLWTRQY